MTDEPRTHEQRTGRIRSAVAGLTPQHVDVAMLIIGALLITLAVGGVDWRAGIFTAGALLLAAALAGRLLTRSRP